MKWWVVHHLAGVHTVPCRQAQIQRREGALERVCLRCGSRALERVCLPFGWRACSAERALERGRLPLGGFCNKTARGGFPAIFKSRARDVCKSDARHATNNIMLT